MTLHFTLVRRPGSAVPTEPLELTVAAPSGTPGTDLLPVLAASYAVAGVTVAGQDLGSLAVGTPPLVNGAVLVACGARYRTDRQQGRGAQRPGSHGLPPASLTLAVHSGPGAGTLIPLRRGTYTIGRDHARISIPDPDLSREHARLVVTDTDIVLVDLDSANGTEVDGVQVNRATVSTSSGIRCGNTTMSLVFVDVPQAPLSDAGLSVQMPLVVPGRSEPLSRALLLPALVPLVVGVGLSAFTGMWLFLAFSAVSAVSVALPVAASRRYRRELSAAVRSAVEQDRQRRMQSAPALSLVALAARQAGATCDDPPPDGLWLRLGLARRPANVLIEPPVPGARIPSAGTVPVSLDPGIRHATIRGPGDLVLGMCRSFLMQLTGYPRGRNARVLVHGPASLLPLAARYLPQVALTATTPACLDALSPNGGAGVFLVLGSPADPAEDSTGDGLPGEALSRGWRVLQFFPAGGPDDSTVILSGRGSTVQSGPRRLEFIPDLASESVFSRFCRQSAAGPMRPDPGTQPTPAACPLSALVPTSAGQTAFRWKSGAGQAGLPVPLGLGPKGSCGFDLEADGPHLLVAGTTGSGKSELLRTLALALALTYPPDRVTFLFIDFKGGSGLGPLAGLVHCVGLLTDLSSHELDRTLASLRAEVRFRERVLAAAGVPDLGAFLPAPGDPPLPHLVIIIDEFRMLVDDAPEVLRELMRIAAVGRSLGLHLVMATQRPQGALTADIRANVTSSIALRVQSEMESMEIIRSPAAAAIGIGLPGRAFLARGSECIQEFQTATSATGRATPPLWVRRAVDQLEHPGAGACEPGAAPTPARAAAPLVALVRDLWASWNGAPPRRPVAAPLPLLVQEPVIDNQRPVGPPWRGGGEPAGAGSESGVQSRPVGLGLLDLPAEQQVIPLVWDPALDSHLALLGGPGSGALDALELAVIGLASHPQESHLYYLDAVGAFRHRAGDHRTGAHAGLHGARHAVRVLELLHQEMARRLGGEESGTPLVLVITGWGSWVSAFRAGPLAWAEELVHDLVRDGSQAAITIIVSGGRELVTARFFGALPNRLFFPAGSTEEGRLAWPRLPAVAAARGRAVAFGPVAGSNAAVCQVFVGSPRTPVAPQVERRPFKVEPLPAVVTVSQVRTRFPGPHPYAAAAGTAAAGPSLVFGIGGDELAPASLPLPPGGVLAVLGGQGSGKSAVLAAIQALNPAPDRWLQLAADADAAARLQRALAEAGTGRLPRSTVLLADDADLLPAAALADLAALHTLGYAVVFTARFSPLLMHRFPLATDVRAAGTALLLSPRSLADGDLLGIRFELEDRPPPGRAVLVSNGRSRPVQVAWAGPSGPAGPSEGGRRVPGPGREANDLAAEKEQGGDDRWDNHQQAGDHYPATDARKSDDQDK